MIKQTTADTVRPYGDIEAVNELSKLFTQQQAEGELDGYSLMFSSDANLTAGDLAREVNDIYLDHLRGNTHDVTSKVLAGIY